MPRKLKKSTTMQQSASEGEGFLKRSWGEEKFKRVHAIYDESEATSTSDKKRPIDEANSDEAKSKKPRLAKHSTMINTAKESKDILKEVKIDADAKTRNQSDQIAKLLEKKPRLAKNRTMNATAEDSKHILKNTKIDETSKTRGQEKAKRKTQLKVKLNKHSTMISTAKEALNMLTDEPLRPRGSTKKNK